MSRTPGVSAVPLTVMPTVVEAEALLVPMSSIEVEEKCSVSAPSYSVLGGVGHEQERGVDLSQRAGDHHLIDGIVADAAGDGGAGAGADRQLAVVDKEPGDEGVGVVCVANAAIGDRHTEAADIRDGDVLGGDDGSRVQHRGVGSAVDGDADGG